MSIMNFFSEMLFRKETGKYKLVPKKSETTQEAAARAINSMFAAANRRNKR
jgi:hypothetical protein